MKAPFRISSWLCLLVSFSYLQAAAAADRGREVKFRVLCLEYQDEIKLAQVAEGKGKKWHEVQLLAASFTEQFEATFFGEEASFFVADPEGPDNRRVVASGELASGSQQVFVLLPNKDAEMPYRLLALNEDEKEFPMGSIRVLNLYENPIRLNIDETDLAPIPAGEHATYPPAETVDKWDMYPVRVDFGTPAGEWFPVASPSWKKSQLKRDVVAVLLDQRSMQPRVLVIKDIPPWRKPKLGR